LVNSSLAGLPPTAAASVAGAAANAGAAAAHPDGLARRAHTLCLLRQPRHQLRHLLLGQLLPQGSHKVCKGCGRGGHASLAHVFKG
jgi:hypothetical protein